jgi:nicotinate phosphoribosyltransferase
MQLREQYIPFKNKQKQKRPVNSLADTDWYKFTMAQAVFHQFNRAHPITRFKFHNRSDDIDLAPFLDEINTELDHICTLSFTDKELKAIEKLPYITQDFVDYLSRFKLKREYIKAWVDAEGLLHIECEGPWIEVIWFEVPVLAIVQEVYTRNTFSDIDYVEAEKRLLEKVEIFNTQGKLLPFNVADFGTRRRFSHSWQRHVDETFSSLVDSRIFTGTSNLLFAIENDIKPIGTMAHEWLQAGQALARVGDSQSFMLDKWVQEYRGELGIALSDVVGLDAFLRDFDKYFAKLYDGVRHDSGDPFEWGDRVIEHYESLGINPVDKVAVFSDGLDLPLALELADYFRGRIRTSFGIGTNLTNDMGVRPLQIVMKMVVCNGSPVAKISDSKGKGMCEDDSYLAYLKTQYKIED